MARRKAEPAEGPALWQARGDQRVLSALDRRLPSSRKIPTAALFESVPKVYSGGIPPKPGDR